ncbi:MAG: tRNA uridine(34) 5-carboxymethylaminomethyl modification radical SAM/GNAT enzyme Elp3 [Acidobacteriota bacterium]
MTRPTDPYAFDPDAHADRLVPLIEALRAAPPLQGDDYNQLIRRHPPATGGAFSKTQILRGFRQFRTRYDWGDEAPFLAKVRLKPVRTLSGVAPVTVLTKPFPCPGKCVFCPNDVRMPKSYLSREPGAQRAAQHRFDPYAQTLGRLLAYHGNGHRVDKVEMIVLGGTWSFYPEDYQVWFIKRCFDAMNDFSSELALHWPELAPGPLGFETIDEIDGRLLNEGGETTYNKAIAAYLRDHLDGRLLDHEESASWAALDAVHRRNETAEARCVGLVLETRPDHLDVAEAIRLRRLGATKIQIGIQSLDDGVLAQNKRGHTVEESRRAMALLRGFGFKLHVHWMPNLLGSTPEMDAVDFPRLFDDPALRPDELKIYPCSLIETAELMRFYDDGSWRPYEHDELLGLLEGCLLKVPEYCRVTRVIRDIPGDDIVDGNQTTNFREVVERSLTERGQRSRDIRAREIRGRAFDGGEVRLEPIPYASRVDDGSTVGEAEEFFLQWVVGEVPDDRIVGFCRLSLPSKAVACDEIRDSAMIREVHVYGGVVAFGDGAGDAGSGRSQHRGLGRRLVEEAARIATERGYRDLAVISAIGTREYYRGLGFEDGPLYLHRRLATARAAAD